MPLGGGVITDSRSANLEGTKVSINPVMCSYFVDSFYITNGDC